MTLCFEGFELNLIHCDFLQGIESIFQTSLVQRFFRVEHIFYPSSLPRSTGSVGLGFGFCGASFFFSGFELVELFAGSLGGLVESCVVVVGKSPLSFVGGFSMVGRGPFGPDSVEAGPSAGGDIESGKGGAGELTGASGDSCWLGGESCGPGLGSGFN